MADEQELITPQWLHQARKNRVMFILRVALLFAICSILAWWIVPTFEGRTVEIAKALQPKALKGAPDLRKAAAAAEVTRWVLWFRLFWGAIAAGCGIAAALALTGKIDSLLPVLNFVLLVAGIGAVAFAFYIYYRPLAL